MARRDSLNPRRSRGSRPSKGTNRYLKNNNKRVKKARLNTTVPTPRLPSETSTAHRTSKSKSQPSKEWQEAKANYRKQYKRVHNFIRRAEKRGYTFDKQSIEVMLPQISTITPQKYSTNNIINLTEGAKTLTPDVLYGFATAKSSVTGETISGDERRKEEREESAQRAKHTRIQHEQDLEEAESEAQDEVAEDSEDVYQKEQRQKDIENLKRLQADQQYRQQFTIGEIVYRKIKEMLDEARANGLNQQAAELESMLDEEISTYGSETVYLNIAQFDQSDVLSNAEIVIFDSDQDNRVGALMYMTIVIRGNLVSAEDAKRMSDASEEDAYTNNP